MWYKNDMAILAGFVLPHSPLLIPQIGREKTEKAEKTLEAIQKIVGEIKSLAPDTIILISPHAESYRDYFQLADGEVGIGSLEKFGAAHVTFRVRYDKAFVHHLSELAKLSSFPAGADREKAPYLDYGAMVPLFYLNQIYSDFNLVRVSPSGLPLLDHYKMGELIKRAANDLSRRAVVIASGDLSHQEVGDTGFAEEKKDYDRLIVSSFSGANFCELLTVKPNLYFKSRQCGHKAFVMMAGVLDRSEVKSSVVSYEIPHESGLICAEFIAKGDNSSRAFAQYYLTRESLRVKEDLVASDPYASLARKAIEYYVNFHSRLPLPNPLSPILRKPSQGVFVTIREYGSIYSSLGSMKPLENNLANEIISNAILAATNSGINRALKDTDFPYLRVQVDLLSPLEKVDSSLDLDPIKYGVVVVSSGRRGLILPRLEGIYTAESQLEFAKRKAGILVGDEVDIYRFSSFTHF